MALLPKSATIGGTINLGNYDNVRFEFGAEITSSEDYLGLVEFAASSLIGQFRNADEITRTTVRGYVAKLCSIDEVQVPCMGQPAQGAPRKEDPAIYESKPVPSTPTTLVTLDQMSPLPARMPAPAPAATCEKCGEGVTESMQKMSQLFASKTLCKKCLDGGAS